MSPLTLRRIEFATDDPGTLAHDAEPATADELSRLHLALTGHLPALLTCEHQATGPASQLASEALAALHLYRAALDRLAEEVHDVETEAEATRPTP